MIKLGLYYKDHVSNLTYTDEVNEGWLWHQNQWLRVFKSMPPLPPSIMIAMYISDDQDVPPFIEIPQAATQNDWYTFEFPPIPQDVLEDMESEEHLIAEFEQVDGELFSDNSWNKSISNNQFKRAGLFLIALSGASTDPLFVRIKRAEEIVHIGAVDRSLPIKAFYNIQGEFDEADRWTVEFMSFAEDPMQRSIAVAQLVVGADRVIVDEAGLGLLDDLDIDEAAGTFDQELDFPKGELSKVNTDWMTQGDINAFDFPLPSSLAYSYNGDLYSGGNFEYLRPSQNTLVPVDALAAFQVNPAPEGSQEFYIFRGNQLVAGPGFNQDQAEQVILQINKEDQSTWVSSDDPDFYDYWSVYVIMHSDDPVERKINAGIILWGVDL